MRLDQLAQLVEIAVAAGWTAPTTSVPGDVLAKLGVAVRAPYLPVAASAREIKLGELFDRVCHETPLDWVAV